MGRPQGVSWTAITPSTPTFSPSKFTPNGEQSTWKPSFQSARNDYQDNVIQGSVKQDPSGGYVHTFGAPRKESFPQSNNAPVHQTFQNSQSPMSRQESISSPRYCQEIVIPTGEANNQYRSPARQTSFQNNSSQASPVRFSPQVSVSETPAYFQPHRNSVNETNGNSGTYYQPNTPSYPPSRQDSVPWRQNSYTAQRQDSINSQPNSWSSPSRQDSFQNSSQVFWNPPSKQDSFTPCAPRQVCSPQPNQVDSNSFQPRSQESWSSSPVRQNSVNTSPNRQEPWAHPSAQQGLFQPSTGLFSQQNSVSPPSPESIVRYEPVSSNAPSGFQRQSSVQYQPSPKPYSPTNHSPGRGKQNDTNNTNSPYTYGSVPGPFSRQQSSAGPKPWSPSTPVDSFSTPPPFSPSREMPGANWPCSSDLPSPPPPPLPQQMPSPVGMVPPPPPLLHHQCNRHPHLLVRFHHHPHHRHPPPPPPMPSATGSHESVIPDWKKQIKATKEAKAAAGISAPSPATPGGGPELPAALAGSMKKDKKPFTYLPGGLDLSEIRSPKMQRRIMANQQQAPPPPSCTGQQVLLQPQLNNQFERLNIADGQQSGDRMAAAVEPQRRPSSDNQDPKTYGQSRSFRILQMMTGGDDQTDSVAPPPSSASNRQDEEMRFTGLRRPDNPIPSRAFHALQKMTTGAEEAPSGTPIDPRCNNETSQDGNEDVPVDIRYKGGYIPGRSFKMLQEMTGMDESGNPTGTVVPSVLQEKRQQKKPPPHLHLNINQPPPPKQFPQPNVPASQQSLEEAPKMYRGGRIPSQSFRILQAMTGESQDSQGEDGTDM
ncbi:uncharacterized protein LOC129227219 isoform X1 [Uloborus diversus]|uniref:uncharacterized protein LOC129227219 isoform X1 n=1 Tax=Uloborus diversus TaxID=327109 RepID=UPI00240A02B1|nr:uncharacterized protein LOC129227219 isoform X1 [Uloborus diversus]